MPRAGAAGVAPAPPTRSDRCSFCCFSIACSELLKAFDGYSSIAILVLILFFRWFERTWCCGCDFFLLFYAAAAKNKNCSKKFLGALFVSSRSVSFRKQKTQKKESFFQRRRGKRQSLQLLRQWERGCSTVWIERELRRKSIVAFQPPKLLNVIHHIQFVLIRFLLRNPMTR